jgi:hypothetical protein
MSMRMVPINWDNLRDFMIALSVVLVFSTIWAFL